MLDLIVFSKDRPAQLDLLLTSVERFFAEWRDVALTVVHVATDDAAARGYARVRELHPEIAFVDERATERSFKEITLDLTGRNPLAAFLMDDQLFKAPFTLRRPEVARFLEDPQTMCLSLRMDPAMDYCYPLDRSVAIPRFEAPGVWRWRAAEGDWAYPMSLDAHIFRTAELRPLLEAVEFRNPNSLEAALANVALPHPRLACLPEAPTVNIPDNRVQEVCDNRHGAGDPAALTARFLAGDRLDLEPLAGIRTPSPHHEIPLTWRSEAGARPLPRVSVVVPCYQHGRHLAEAVESALAQEEVDVDVTIVDDGSTDSTDEVARALVARGGGRVRVLTTVNSGHPAHPRNAGVRASEAPYVVCLDADDRLGPGYLAALAGALDENPEAGFAYGDYAAFGDADFVERTPAYDAARLAVVNIVGSASMFRRAAWEAVGGYDGSVGYEDWDFWIGCADAGWHGVKVPSAVWHYRVEGEGRYASDQQRDAQIKAQLALKRPHLYSDSYLASARAIVGTGAAPVAEPPEPADALTRAFATVAVVDEALAHPELLAAYAARFGADDDATLVLLALDGDADGAAARVLPLLERLGIDGDDGPDMVAVGAPPAEVAEIATAILTAGEVPPALDGLEPFGAADADRLRARAEAAWRALAPVA